MLMEVVEEVEQVVVLEQVQSFQSLVLMELLAPLEVEAVMEAF